MTKGNTKSTRTRSHRSTYKRRRNPQVYRLQMAVRFYQDWQEQQMVEKAGNLTGRLLAINKVLGERHGKEILSPTLREALLTLYTQLTPEERWEKRERKNDDDVPDAEAETPPAALP
jgi:hypothetical protein